MGSSLVIELVFYKFKRVIYVLLSEGLLTFADENLFKLGALGASCLI